MHDVDTIEPSDELLVSLARDGDADAFEPLVLRHQDRVYRLALRLTGNASDAEEVTQEAFLQAYRGLRDFRGDARFGTWLCRIVANAALMRRRASRVRPTEPLERYLPAFDDEGGLLGHGPDCARAARADELLERRQLGEHLRAALARLEEPYRSVFVLRDLEELTSEETAAILGTSNEAVRQRLHRARVLLRGYLRALVGEKP
jgi:RNA polymerase sigma-70 factor (ECF subfamily)